MVMTPLRTPTFPDVPKAPGVPPVFRAPTQPVFTARLLIADAVTILGMFAGPQWGIFTTGGQPFAIPDSVVSVELPKGLANFRLSGRAGWISVIQQGCNAG